MTCQANNCKRPGTYSERFKAVLCQYHFVLALLAWLNDKQKML